MTDAVLTYLQDHHDRFVEELISWLRIPSISTYPEQAGEVRRAANWAREKLVAIGFPVVEIITTSGHPLVYAEWLVYADQPTLLVYGHYDVQPAEPLDEWLSPPFEPAIRDGNLYARGAVDDKGQVMLVLAALEAWSRTTGGIPINVKVLLEGEEEVGGEAIDAYVKAHSDKLKADAALICDTSMLSERQPSLVTGLRGLLYTEIGMHGARSDLHSGSFGGVAPNPVHALCVVISRLKGADGVIHIPELNAALQTPPSVEKKFWDDDPLDLEGLLIREMGVNELVGESAYPPLERLWARPTLEVHGIRGGFTGEGAKTVIPASALAKVSLRLPAGLQPEEVFGWFEKAVRTYTPEGYRVAVTRLHAGEGVLVPTDSLFVQAAVAALEATYGVAPVFTREGGSIPVAALFDQILQLPVVLMGFGLPDDGLHAPNEKFSLAQFARGMSTVADFLGRLQQ